MQNSILVQNSAAASGPDCMVGFTSQGCNLIGSVARPVDGNLDGQTLGTERMCASAAAQMHIMR